MHQLHLSLAAMIFERQDCKPISKPSEKKIALELSRMKRTFASVTADDGAYLQVVGGPGLFALERRDSEGLHFRASQETPVVQFEDGTVMTSTVGNITLARAEWFLINQITEIMVGYINGADFPRYVAWRRLSSDYL